MWAKILAGVVAAVAVAGGGIYFAVSSNDCSHGCDAKRAGLVMDGGTCPGDEESSCCVRAAGTCCMEPVDDAKVAAKTGCCSESAGKTDAAAACAGAAAVSAPAPCDKGECPHAK
jgi:hypothetical protein